MSSLKIYLVLACLTAVAAVSPTKTSGNLRFKSQAKAGALGDEDKKVLSPGDAKPLSTAMKCVMSLLFLYFIVVIIMKAIIFTKQLKNLYAQTTADMGIGKKAKDGAAEEGAPETSDADGKSADAPAKATTTVGAATDTFKNMFSEEKLSKVMTNMAMVPMFCILITFCRLRARVDLETEPQPFAKLWMMISTACLFVQILSCMLPDIPETPGATGCCTAAKAWLYVLEVVNLAGMLGLYAGVGMICYAIFTLKYKESEMKVGLADKTAAATESAAASADVSGAGSAFF